MADNNHRIYLSSPHMGGEELNYVQEAFDTNWIAPLGANVNGFEEDLQKYTGRKHAAAVTSGTAAIHLALILCDVKPGDEVICQSFTFAASANPILYQGAEPVFVDSEPGTWNMDPELLEKAIVDRMQCAGNRVQAEAERKPRPPRSAAINGKTDREGEKATGRGGDGKKRINGGKPKAIVVVHLYGMPAKMGRILEIARKYDIPVIEDAAEALGSAYHGAKCGSFGKMSVLSFNGNKIITSSGGGALLSDDEELVKKSRFLATQARDDAPHYQHSELGFNYRMSNIVAGIGRGQMKVIDDRVAQRRANHDFYFKELGGAWYVVNDRRGDGAMGRDELLSAFSFQDSVQPSQTGVYFLKEPEGYKSNRWLTTVLINPEETGGVTRDDIRLALEDENIECRPLWKPMHLQPLYEGFPIYTQQRSSAESASADEWKREESSNSSVQQEWTDEGSVSGCLFKYGLCLPSGSNMSSKDMWRVVGAVKRVLAKGKG